VIRDARILTKERKVSKRVCKPDGDEDFRTVHLRKSNDLNDIKYVLNPEPTYGIPGLKIRQRNEIIIDGSETFCIERQVWLVNYPD
jgi:hypothetical protein